MSLSDFGQPMGDCNVDDLTLIPVIPAMDEPLYNSSTTDRVFLRELVCSLIFQFENVLNVQGFS